MKKILLLIATPFIFLSAFSATPKPTQEDADKIVLQHLSQETRNYTVYAKKSVQTNMIITTSAGEVLELDYPCWVYCVSLNTAGKAFSGRYFIVNESNGNLLEVNPKSIAEPNDLAEWREVTNVLKNCDQNVIISSDEYEKLSDVPFPIQDMKIVGNCLKIRIGASGCDGNSWIVKLVDWGNILTINPPKRLLRLSFENNEICDAVISREFSFNIEDLQVQGTNKIWLNIAGNGILYEYEYKKEEGNYSTIAFIAQDSAGKSLCTMDKSGNGMRKIVDKTVACQKPVRSHFRTKLLFTSVKFDSWTNADNSVGMSSEYELYIVNTDGTNLTLIDRIDSKETGSFGSVAWSPDDSQIVYVKYSGASWEKRDLILYNISDNTHTIIQTEGNVCSPKFSPDGKQIVYCATVKSDTLFIHSHRNHHIYKIDINGENNHLFINEASSPKWSPKGDKIVYLSSGIDGSSQIFVANADGSGQKQLTSSVSPEWWDTGFPRDGNSDPQWTPDGKKIVYVSCENGKPEIFIMNVDGNNQTRLTTAEFRDESPEITPDGQYILFSSRRSDMMNDGICIMALNGSNQKVLSKVGNYPVACK